MKICRYCGTENSDFAGLCKNCKNELYTKEEMETKIKGIENKLSGVDFGETSSGKTLVTMQSLVQKSFKFEYIITIVPAAFFFLFFFIFIGCFIRFSAGAHNGALVIIIALVFFSISLIIFTKTFKNISNNKNALKNGNFKIYEDECYDRFTITHRDSDGDSDTDYYVCGKLYGKIKSSHLYHNVDKDVHFYIVVGDNNKEDVERLNGFSSKDIISAFSTKTHELSEDLQHKVVAYNPQLGEANFNEIMNSKKQNFKSSIFYKFTCENCRNTFSSKKDTCPKCGTIHQLSNKDVVSCKDWY